MGAVKSLASQAKRVARRRRAANAKQPLRKKTKFDISDKRSEPGTGIHSGLATSCSQVLETSSYASEEKHYDISRAIGGLICLLRAPGPMQLSLIKRKLIEVKKQAQRQSTEMQQLKHDFDEAKTLADAREEQMDKMSTYMWPAQLLNMWTDERDETIRQGMMRRREKDDARFEEDLEAGLVSLLGIE